MAFLSVFSLSLLFSNCAPNVLSPEQLNKKGFYQEAENTLNSKKNLPTKDKEELLISLYNQRKYQEATTLLNTLNQVELMSNAETKQIVPALRRISGDYQTSDLTKSLSESDINQFYKWPTANKELGKVALTKTPLLSDDEQFTGASFDPSKEQIYLGKSAGKQEMMLPYYSIKSASFKNNLVADGWKSLSNEVEKNRIYTTSPSISSNKTMYFSMSLFDGVVMNPSKMVAWNKDSLVNYLGIFTSTLDNSGKISPLPEKINQLGSNNTHPHILNDTILFFASDRAKKGNMDIYYSILKFGNWSTPTALSMNSNYDDIMPVSDGKNLYFSSRGHKNFGGLDVFKSKLNFANGEITTGAVENMMLPFNSSSDDMMALMLDGSTGYLATNRNKDNGDEIYHFKIENGDIFSSKLVNPLKDAVEGTLVVYSKDKNGQWAEDTKMSTNGVGVIENINLQKDREYKLVYSSTNYDEAAIFIPMQDETNAKTRENQIKELSTVALPWIKSQGIVKDRISDQVISGVDIQIEFTDLNGEQVFQKFKSDKEGKWMFDILPGKDYKLSASKKGYEGITNKAVSSQDLGKIELIAMSQESKKGDKVSIPNIYFDFNSSKLQEKSFPILENIVSYLSERPDMKVELSAHTDAVGSDAYNLKLSNERALSCYNNLIEGGVPAKQLLYKGYGETQLVNNCKNGVTCSEQENEVNRRVELKVLSEGEVIGKEEKIDTKESTDASNSRYGLSPDGGYYLVKEGETLYRVFVTTKVSVNKIKELNGLSNNNTFEGMRLKLK
jgi:outer membrane protein OmpA-like peptidoglycan-associated protein